MAVVTSGVVISVEPMFAVADVETDFVEFVAAAASGNSTDPSNPSAPAALGSLSVRPRGTAEDPQGRTVYVAGGG